MKNHIIYNYGPFGKWSVETLYARCEVHTSPLERPSPIFSFYVDEKYIFPTFYILSKEIQNIYMEIINNTPTHYSTPIKNLKHLKLFRFWSLIENIQKYDKKIYLLNDYIDKMKEDIQNYIKEKNKNKKGHQT